jgi:hypothetical protein
MFYVYLVCFLIGGTLLVGQFLLMLLGLGHDHDIGGHDFHDVGGHDFHGDAHDAHDAQDAHDAHDGHDHHTGHDAYMVWFASVLTFRTLVAALTFFGVAGLAANAQSEESPFRNLAIAVAAGLGALLLVAYLMKSLSRLKSDGTARIDRAVGQSGTVYLTIPAQKAGVGKVQVNVQNRTMEYQAVTPNAELPTGVKIVVVRVINSDTVEVAPATESGV